MALRCSALRLLLLAVNIASTVLTIFTGLKENALLVYVSDKYGLVLSWFVEDRITYNLLRDDLVDKGMLVNLTRAGTDFRFMAAPQPGQPRRGQEHVHAYQLGERADAGDSLRRLLGQRAAPHPGVYAQHLGAAVLRDQLQARLGQELHLGAEQQRERVPSGAPFLKCLGRPERAFDYVTDLLVQYSYWADGSYHLELQSSKCLALPLLRNADMKYGLF